MFHSINKHTLKYSVGVAIRREHPLTDRQVVLPIDDPPASDRGSTEDEGELQHEVEGDSDMEDEQDGGFDDSQDMVDVERQIPLTLSTPKKGQMQFF